MSDTNRVGLAQVQEVTYGLIPATPAFKALRYTGAPSLQFSPKTVASNEIRADRQTSDLALVGAEAGGSVDHELSFESLDDMIAAAMFADWEDKALREGTSEVTDITVTTDINVAAGESFQEGDIVQMEGWPIAANNIVLTALVGTISTLIKSTGLTNDTSAVGTKVRTVGFEGAAGDIDAVAGGTNGLTSTVLDFTTLGLVIGEWVKIGGSAVGDKFVNADLNDWARISVIAVAALDFDIVPVNWAAETGTGLTIKLWFGSRIRNGTLQKSFSLERAYNDHVPVTFEYFRGMVVSGIGLGFNAQEQVTMTTNFLGKDALLTETREAGATDVPAPGTAILNTSSNVGRIAEGGLDITGPNFVLSGTINIENNLRQQNAIGSLGAIGIGTGEFTVTGALSTYFGNKDLVEKVLNNTETNFDIRFKSATDQVLLIDLPRVKYSAGAANVAGKNDDVLADLEYQALLDATLNYTMHIARYYYTEV